VITTRGAGITAYRVGGELNRHQHGGWHLSYPPLIRQAIQWTDSLKPVMLSCQFWTWQKLPQNEKAL